MKTCSLFFFYNYPPTTSFYTLPLTTDLPIPSRRSKPSRSCSHGPGLGTRQPTTSVPPPWRARAPASSASWRTPPPRRRRSEEHTSELQSRQYLVCRLLLEKKNKFPEHLGKMT